MKRTAGYLVLMAILAVWAGPVISGAYKWVDEQGVTHFSQSPPKGGKAEELKLPASSTADATEKAADMVRKKMEAYQKRREAKKKKRDMEAEEKSSQAQNRKNCDMARNNMDVIQRGRGRYRDKDGNISGMSDGEFQTKIEQARKQVEEFCKE